MTRLDEELRAQILNVQPGDTIALLHPKPLSADHIHLLQKQAAQIWPDNEIVIFAGGIEVEIRKAAFDEAEHD